MSHGYQYSGDNSYIFKGEGPESYAARFNWFVFSAVEITNWPGELIAEHLTAEAVNTWIEESAHFETSNPTFNDINKIWKRSQLDNMHGGIASDCPHRERAPYTGDGQVACVTVMHNFDAKNFYHKWMQDILGAQNVETGKHTTASTSHWESTQVSTLTVVLRNSSVPSVVTPGLKTRLSRVYLDVYRDSFLDAL